MDCQPHLGRPMVCLFRLGHLTQPGPLWSLSGFWEAWGSWINPPILPWSRLVFWIICFQFIWLFCIGVLICLFCFCGLAHCVFLSGFCCPCLGMPGGTPSLSYVYLVWSCVSTWVCCCFLCHVLSCLIVNPVHLVISLLVYFPHLLALLPLLFGSLFNLLVFAVLCRFVVHVHVICMFPLVSRALEVVPVLWVIFNKFLQLNPRLTFRDISCIC